MIGADQSTKINTSLQVRNLFIDITDYPNFVRGQGSTGDVQYSDEVETVVAATDVELLLWKSETNYPNTAGHLIRVWYEIGFQLKAANDSADVTYKLQGRDADSETWIDMCAEVACADIDTSWVTKLVKGYLDIQDGISKLPFEMRLIFKSSESSTEILVEFSCTWSAVQPGGTGSCRSVGQGGDNLYAGCNDTVYYQTGNDSWSACSGAMGQVRGFCYSDVSDSDVLYAVRNGTVIKLAGTVWSEIAGSPSDCWSILEFGSKIYVGTAAGDVYSSTDGANFTTTSLTGGGAVRGLCVFGNVVYAACAGGKVWRLPASTVWEEVASSDLSGVDNCYCLCEHDSELYVGTGNDTANEDKVFVMNGAGTAWASTGDLLTNYNYDVYALVSFDKNGKGAVLYAASGNSANVHYFDGTDWTNSGDLSGDYQALCLAVYTENDTIYCGSNNYAKVWKASISETWESGEGIGRLKNDEASDGQKTRLEIVGRII